MSWYIPAIEHDMYAHYSQRDQQPPTETALSEAHSEFSRSFIVTSLARIVAFGLTVGIVLDQLRHAKAQVHHDNGGPHA